MIMIANLQYGWTLFVNPINKAHGWSITSIQVAFSIFIALETWLTPIQGWIVDILGPQRGPKLMVAFGGITVAIGWMINAYATSLEMLYLGAIVSGAGGGAVYATCVGNAVKWFPDRRGLAVGLTAAGYGAGAALTVIPIRYVIDNYGYNAAFLWFGIVQGAVVRTGSWEYLERNRGPCAFRRPYIPDLGGDLQPISFHVHRYVRPEIRNGELEPALHGERNFGVPRSDRKRGQVVDRELAHGVCSHRTDEFRGGRACLVCETAAAADARRRLTGVARFRAIAVISDGPCRSLPMDRL
jgi:MFS family permease